MFSNVNSIPSKFNCDCYYQFHENFNKLLMNFFLKLTKLKQCVNCDQLLFVIFYIQQLLRLNSISTINLVDMILNVIQSYILFSYFLFTKNSKFRIDVIFLSASHRHVIVRLIVVRCVCICSTDVNRIGRPGSGGRSDKIGRLNIIRHRINVHIPRSLLGCIQ